MAKVEEIPGVHPVEKPNEGSVGSQNGNRIPTKEEIEQLAQRLQAINKPFRSIEYFGNNMPRTVLDGYYNYFDGFSRLECDRIIELAMEMPEETGTVGNNNISPEIRKSKVRWFGLDDPRYTWIYEKLAYFVKDANEKMWHFGISGFKQDAQFTTYYAEEGGHYAYHMDVGESQPTRKISITVQLSDPSDYEGGDLEFLTTREPYSVKKDRGIVIVFPSYFLHRVQRVTKGVRHSLVLWTSGSPFH
jgi:PKHD-type hydroxylase